MPVNLSRRQKELLEEFASESKDGRAKKNHPQTEGFFDKVKEFWSDLTD